MVQVGCCDILVVLCSDVIDVATFSCCRAYLTDAFAITSFFPDLATLVVVHLLMFSIDIGTLFVRPRIK